MKSICPQCKAEITVYITTDNSVQDFHCPNCKVRLRGKVVTRVELEKENQMVKTTDDLDVMMEGKRVIKWTSQNWPMNMP